MCLTTSCGSPLGSGRAWVWAWGIWEPGNTIGHGGSCNSHSLLFSLSPPLSLPVSRAGLTSLWWPDPVTTQRLGVSFLKPRFRPCLMLATGSTVTNPKTSWMPSAASWHKKWLLERADRELGAGIFATGRLLLHRPIQVGTERAQRYRGRPTLFNK